MHVNPLMPLGGSLAGVLPNPGMSASAAIERQVFGPRALLPFGSLGYEILASKVLVGYPTAIGGSPIQMAAALGPGFDGVFLTNVAVNNSLFGINGYGGDTSGTYQVGAAINLKGEETWSATARGTYVQFRAMGVGTTVFAETARLSSVGNWSVAGSMTSYSPTGGVGYSTGAGGAVTQITSKATGVTLSKTCGQITMNNAALAAGAKVTFTVTNTACATLDCPVVCVDSGGTASAYRADVTAVGAGSFAVTVENITAGSLSEAPVINFAIIKAVTS